VEERERHARIARMVERALAFDHDDVGVPRRVHDVLLDDAGGEVADGRRRSPRRDRR
jgi:hypothetical protein